MKDVIIKINHGKNPGFFLESSKEGIETVPQESDARVFHHPSKAKMEMLKLILDHRVPRNSIEIVGVQNG